MDLDEDVLRAAKHLAQEREQSLGRVLSDLVRSGLQPKGKFPCGVERSPFFPENPAPNR